ncbi:glycosyltransferase family 4 protein [Vibrio cholerae]|uniref:WblE protein n=1 Tax=Vibrio cholerae TaxID=666 RepID=O87161_VIBCL|nr:glycosyltransferase family 4 protein [Vibrio cholerae]EGR4118460.1 glycosyltransferase family 1 protein [Vibrio cholerae]EJL6604580.1 glycosyltransferase family 4 protein [Vibrio cholerae]EJL6623063.1 glycosyltransferase family 4 protein [Vibrio cholerae]EKF9418443.1 glycosyltransferase family 4 protein [Vibrio cholerae]EKF9577806.1 glycosyltransferase family 4 protein [Vibrio cholerae]
MKSNDFVVVHVITSDSGGGAENLVSNMLDSDGLFLQYAIYFSSFISGYRRPNTIYFGSNPRSLLNIFKLRKTIKMLIEKHGELIVHAHLTWPLFYVALGLFNLNVKLVYTEHSTFNKRRKYPFLKFFERLVYSRYSRIVGISNSVSKSIEVWLGSSFLSRIVTINNGARFYSFKCRHNLELSKKIKLLSVGSLKPLKGFDKTIKSLSKITQYIDKYTIVGTGPSYDTLKEISLDNHVDHLVDFVGWSNELEKFYHEADILLIPSHWEGFGLSAVEGMSTGLPVIASNVDGLNEVVSKTLNSSILVENFLDENSWADAILEMKKKLSSDYFNMSIESKQQAYKFSFDKMFKEYTDLYKWL